MTFESFCLVKSSVKNGHFNVLAAFSLRIGLNKVRYVRITITHVYFIALTNTCRVPREMLEYSAYRLRVQTASSGPGTGA